MQVIEPGSLSEDVWRKKYRFDGESSWDDTCRRVAKEISSFDGVEDRNNWYVDFYLAMVRFEWLPGGRILAGAGTGRDVTLVNCFVMPTIPDSLEGIMDVLDMSARTMKMGGGIGMDYSTLRPRGSRVASVDSVSSGAVSFMDMWNSMCGTIMSAGARRGAMMGVLRCDHPDIEEFIAAKQTAGRLTNFNISVAVTDSFMQAVKADGPWHLVFGGTVYRTVSARELWDKILRSTYEYAEPGVVFIDRINDLNPLKSMEAIAATNPCGEQPLPPNGACVLGSINLAQLVRHPFQENRSFDWARLDELSDLAVRFLDAVVDCTTYPLEEQHEESSFKRRIGIGITGLADALIMMGLRYGSVAAVDLADEIMHRIKTRAMFTSVSLGDQFGRYNDYDEEHGRARRNSHLLSIAPTGTISIVAGNVSSGIEPVFAFKGLRRILQDDGSHREVETEDYAYRLARQMGFATDGPEWVTADDLTPAEHIKMAAAVQRHVDSAVSKTINCPSSMKFEDFGDVYKLAYDSGLKGCSTYRPSGVRGAVLLKAESPSPQDSKIVQFGKPLERPKVVDGKTYKIKPAGTEHALYVTINDIEQDGRMRPFEIFFNSKSVDGYAWTVALSRMISAVFRKGGDVSFIGDELKAVFDPRGGYWHDGKYVPSVCAAIGGVIEQHMSEIGFLDGKALKAPEEAIKKHCPKCQVGALASRDGCWSCMSCDYTKC